MASFILTFHDVFSTDEQKEIANESHIDSSINTRFEYIWRLGIVPYLQTQSLTFLNTIDLDAKVKRIDIEHNKFPIGLQTHQTNMGTLIYTFNKTDDALVFPLLNYKTFFHENSLIFIPPSLIYTYFTIKSSKTRKSASAKFNFMKQKHSISCFTNETDFPIVHDNFISKDECSHIMELIEDIPWFFGKTTFKHAKNNDFEYMFWMKSIHNKSYFSNYIFQRIQNLLQMKFRVLRIYVNGQNYGQDGQFHTDDDREKTYTAIMYLSDCDSDFGGFTQFKISNNITCIEPLFGRLIVFRSDVVHRALAPFRAGGHQLRLVLVYKLQGI